MTAFNFAYNPMKKILTALLFIFVFAPCVYAIEEEIKLEENPDGDFVQSVTGQTKEEFEQKLQADKDTFLSNLKSAPQDVLKLQIERTDVPSQLLKKQLMMKFDRGPLESFHTWVAIQGNITTQMNENSDTDTKYNMALINIIFDGKFRGGKEGFRLMLDPTPTHAHGFLQQLVQDAYIETNRIPHHNVLLGNSRPGVGYEGAQSPYTLPFVARSQISRNLANVRKFGLRVRGDYSLVDYDFGGYSSDTFFREFFPGFEFDGWVNVKPLGKTDGKWGKVVAGGGIVAGKRHSLDYFMTGAALSYEYKKFWARAEYANSDGSNGGSGPTTNRAEGFYATAAYHLTKKIELLARFDEFNPDKTKDRNNQREYTAGVNYYLKGQALKLIFNYVYCENDAKPDSHKFIVGTQIVL